eukprot:Hpha_TRINITY_DN19069_c0_g1::TRINITY_DN19069_c0_g1_i1::g.138249::m.138249/K15445/TRMT10A, TRM10, RG9MTD2; tRNA (guanine9-N1)-methyltransferase
MAAEDPATAGGFDDGLSAQLVAGVEGGGSDDGLSAQQVAEEGGGEAGGEAGLSKRKMKRLKRMGGEEGIREHWAKKKRQQKEKQRQKRLDLKRERDAAWEDLPEEERVAKRNEIREQLQKERREKEAATKTLETRIAEKDTLPQCVIDMSFDAVMDDRGAKSSAQQVSLCYSLLRRALLPMWLRVIGCAPGGRLEKGLFSKPGWDTWTLSYTNKTIEAGALGDVGGDVIYLTGDSDVVLSEVSPRSAYIIGGFVDRNSKKGLTLEKAQRLGLKHARLPIQEYVDVVGLKINKTLTINHVCEILAKVAAGASWPDAFSAVLPLRRAQDEAKQAVRETFRNADVSLSARESAPPAAKQQRTGEGDAADAGEPPSEGGHKFEDGAE